MRICLHLAYDGTEYHGFQRQPQNVPTIQGVLEKALHSLYGETISVISSGRTDKGVHAADQVVCYQSSKQLFPVSKISLLLNKKLPIDIRIFCAYEVSLDFHPRYQAKVRWYRYRLFKKQPSDQTSSLYASRSTFSLTALRYAHPSPCLLSCSKLSAYLNPFCGTHDFTSFCSIHDTSHHKIRQIYHIALLENKEFIKVDVYANAFLRSMVRAIMGTVMDAYVKKLPVKHITSLLQKQNPTLVKHRAPAKGLCLQKVFYTPLFGNAKPRKNPLQTQTPVPCLIS